jgi:hypothetical protein
MIKTKTIFTIVLIAGFLASCVPGKTAIAGNTAKTLIT